MLPELTPDQWAKIKRGWVPVAGHLYVDPADTHGEWFRVWKVVDGAITFLDEDGWVCTPDEMVSPDNLAPCFWGDHATADGLPRTARQMWKAKILARYDVGVDLFAIRRGHQWNISLCDSGAGELFVKPVGVGGTEEDAWLAAILAAPEAG